MNRDDAMIFLRAILIAAIIVCSSAAFAKDRASLDCTAIRSAVAEHGRIAAIRWAREQGYTWAQIAEARKCLR